MATVATTRPPPAAARLSPWEQFDALPDDTKAELIDGELVYVMPASRAHNRVVGLVYALMLAVAAKQGSGEAFTDQLEMRLGSQRFVPDASFRPDRAPGPRAAHPYRGAGGPRRGGSVAG